MFSRVATPRSRSPTSQGGEVAAVIALVVAAAVLAVGSAAVFTFEMDTVVSLADNRLVGTHYGFYNTIIGIGILAENWPPAVVANVHAFTCRESWRASSSRSARN